MKFNTEVDHYNVQLTFDVPEDTKWINSYYFRNCLFFFDLNKIKGNPSMENEEKLEKTISDLFADIAIEGKFFRTTNHLIYSIKPKKLRGFRSIEVFEPMVEGQVKHLLTPLKNQSELFKNSLSIELVIDAIHGYH